VDRQKHYLPTLDGWRALSVIAVVLFHGRNQFFGESSRLARFSSRGFLGVDTFFAISGFLICGMLLQEFGLTSDIDLRRFYSRRFFRIVPPYYAVLGATCFLGLLGVIRPNFLDVPSCLFFYRDFMPLGMDWHGGYYTAHFWTLAIEEQFYLTWPIVLLALKPKKSSRVALFLCAAAYLSKVMLGYFPMLSGVIPLPMNLLFRTDTLLWGCLAALYLPEIRQAVQQIRFSQLWLPTALLLMVGQVSNRPELTLLSAILLPALVLSTVLQPQSLLSRFLEWWPLRWLGTLSYSIYLWQMIFLPPVASEMAHGPFRYLQQSPWNVLAILGCACLSRYLVEIPMIRLGHRLAASRVSVVGPMDPVAAVR
jgi:peptidoglycan/LPS O-acetylase OafA/YrhL